MLCWHLATVCVVFSVMTGLGTNKTKIVFMDGSAQSNPGPTGFGVIISMESTYEG